MILTSFFAGGHSMRLPVDELLEGIPRVKAISQVFDIYFQSRDVTRSDAKIIKKSHPESRSNLGVPSPLAAPSPSISVVAEAAKTAPRLSRTRRRPARRKRGRRERARGKARYNTRLSELFLWAQQARGWRGEPIEAKLLWRLSSLQKRKM